MPASNTIEILKSAILLEMRGESFYKQVANTATDKDVKEFFMLMAQEEHTHKEILSNELKEYGVSGAFKPGAWIPAETSKVASKVLSEKIVGKINAAGFEAAAIVAAISMEQEAVKLYSARAKASDDDVEKELYTWLAAWEQSHMNELVEMDKNLKEQIWGDNHFWPF